MDILKWFLHIHGFEYDDGKRCGCGKYKECIAKPVIGEPIKNLPQCGKFQEQSKKMHKIFEAQILKAKAEQQNVLARSIRRRK